MESCTARPEQLTLRWRVWQRGALRCDPASRGQARAPVSSTLVVFAVTGALLLKQTAPVARPNRKSHDMLAKLAGGQFGYGAPPDRAGPR
jgi:hypothetical protein